MLMLQFMFFEALGLFIWLWVVVLMTTSRELVGNRFDVILEFTKTELAFALKLTLFICDFMFFVGIMLMFMFMGIVGLLLRVVSVIFIMIVSMWRLMSQLMRLMHWLVIRMGIWWSAIHRICFRFNFHLIDCYLIMRITFVFILLNRW